jgi:hypothetical protein
VTELEALAWSYHTTVQGEYGCPGLSCSGVKSLLTLLETAQTLAVNRVAPAVPVSAVRALLKTHAQYQGYGALRDDLTALCDQAEREGKP